MANLDSDQRIALLLLAAGASSRMRGGDKLLEDVDGQPCLRVMAQRGLDAGARVFVTLPAGATPRRDALDGLAITPVVVLAAAEGMSQSLRVGVSALPDSVRAVMILPADMPEITAADLRSLMQAFGDPPVTPVLRASTADGRPGHPILFDRSLFAQFETLSGDRGAFHLVNSLGSAVQLHPLAGSRARTDLDTPEDWAEWRCRRERV